MKDLFALCVIALLGWSEAGAVPVNGDFTSGLSGWTVAGGVSGTDGEAVFNDSGGSGMLYQGSSVEIAQYELKFDFSGSLSPNVPASEPFGLHDTFFASLYLVNDLSAFNPDAPPGSSLALFDLDSAGLESSIGTIGASALGGSWQSYTLRFMTSSWFVIPFFDLVDQNAGAGTSTVRIDNVSLTAVCEGTCSLSNPDRDEDGDGVSNCGEIDDETLPCDSGSFIEKLQAWACAGPNGFFKQVNIASVLNRQSQPLSVRADYRDMHGDLRGTISFTLQSQQKQDILVNELGLVDDSYGTLCIYTDAQTAGAWAGGLVIYKQREIGTPWGSNFDYALHYPFGNPKTGRQTVSVNTCAINNQGFVANWLRITDAVYGDGLGLTGELRYYNMAGDLVGTQAVNLPDGGRFDSGGHEYLPNCQVGLADFAPASPTAEYYLEMSRYHYEAGAVDKFFSAYTIPVRPITGAELGSRIATHTGETAIVEIINSTTEDAYPQVQLLDQNGAVASDQIMRIPRRGSYHRIVGASELSPRPGGGQIGSVSVAGGDTRISPITIAYAFNGTDYSYASGPPLVESAGRIQYTEFNTFLGHVNTLVVTNTLTQALLSVRVTVYNLDGSVLKDSYIDLPARGTTTVELSDLPADTYGTIRVEAGRVGLIVTNEQVKPNEYMLVHAGG